jgi:hypothetical protein
MKALTIYVATDGSRWDDPVKCAERDVLDARVKAIEATIPAVPSSGHVVVDEAAMLAAKRAVVDICRELFPKQTVFRHDAAEIHPFSFAGRFLSEVGGPLNRIWFRFSCCNGPLMYEQPYYALNPEKYEAPTSA